jgi:hypothetical protein
LNDGCLSWATKGFIKSLIKIFNNLLYNKTFPNPSKLWVRLQIIYSIDIQQALAFLGKSDKTPVVHVPVPRGSSELRSDKRATLKQLQDFQIKVVVEIQRLSVSGTSDPVIVARIQVLQKIKADIDQVIDRLQKRQLTPETVPIFATDLERSLPVLGRPDAPLPNLLKGQGLPGILASLFPGGLSAGPTQIASVPPSTSKLILFYGASQSLVFTLSLPRSRSTPIATTCPLNGSVSVTKARCLHLLSNNSPTSPGYTRTSPAR